MVRQDALRQVGLGHQLRQQQAERGLAAGDHDRRAHGERRRERAPQVHGEVERGDPSTGPWEAPQDAAAVHPGVRVGF
jgi:hypothetical protein